MSARQLLAELRARLLGWADDDGAPDGFSELEQRPQLELAELRLRWVEDLEHARVTIRRALQLAARGRRFKTREAAEDWGLEQLRALGAERYRLRADVGEIEDAAPGALRFYPLIVFRPH